MNCLNLRSTKAAAIAIFLFLSFSSAVYAQVSYAINGTLSLQAGSPDPLNLDGDTVVATATMTQNMAGSGSTTSASSSKTFSVTGVKVALSKPPNGTPITITCPGTVGVTITDNVGAPDTIQISNCTLKILGITAVINATATLPNGNMSTAVPATIPVTNLNSGTISYTINGGSPGAFDLTGGSIVATGTAPPAITPSPNAWTPSAPLGSTLPLSQPIHLSASAAVSFTTAATSSGGNWLSVSPAEANTSTTLTVTADPTGLPMGSYNGTVTLTVQQGVTPVVIPVTLTVAGPTISLTGPASMNFAYTVGTTQPASQALNIGSSPASSTSVNAAVTAGNSWLSISPASGTTPAGFTVSVNTTGLTAQTYNGNIQITATGVTNSPLNVPVSFVVTAATLTVPNSLLTFNYTIGGNAPGPQSVNISGTSGINFSTTTSGGTWLSATPSGTVPSSVSVSVDTTDLAAGTYNGSVAVTSAGATGSPASIPVKLVVTAPTLTATPSQLNFAYQLGASSQPAAQSISVGDPSNISFTATAAGGSWLSVSPGSGSASGTLSVAVNTAGLAANTYTGTITVSATGATPQVVNVSFVVTQPNLTISTNSLNYAFQIGGTTPPGQQVNIGGTSGLAFTATAAGGAWLSVSPGGGNTPGTVTVSVDPSVLTANTYNGTITIAAPGATSQVVNVTLVVSSSPTISASPSTLDFTYQIGGTTPQGQLVTIGGTSGLAFTATAAGGSWLSASPGSGTTPGSTTVSVNTTGLTANTYNGTITISATGANPQVVNVTLVVSSAPAITPTPSSLSFTFAIGGSVPAAQSISLGGGTGLAFTAATGASWLSVTPTSGTTPRNISVSLNSAGLTNLTAATYHSSITITSSGASNSPVTVPVALTVTGTAPTLTLSSPALNFNAITKATPPPPQTVDVTSTAQTPVSVAIDGGSWLSATISAATSPATITVSANQGSLTPGNYQGAVVVSSTSASNSPQYIAVHLTVAAPTTITATPGSLSFAYVLGGTAPVPQSVAVASNVPVTITTSVANGAWLTVTSSTGTTPSTLTAAVNAATLAAGTYQATISVTSAGASNSPLTIPVTLVVSNKPTLAPSPSSLTFTAASGGPNPANQTINLAGSAPLAFTVATSPSWLSVSAGASTTPATLVASVNTSGMNEGTFQGAITITSAAAGNSPVSIPVTLAISAPQVSAGPSIAAIVSGASYDSTGFAGGTIATIFGDLLGPKIGSTFSLNSKGGVDSTLAGVTVTVGGVPAIPLFVQNGQVNIILPFNLGTSGQAKVEVQYNNLTSPEFNIPLAAADVQIFTADASGSGPGSILNPDYSINTATNPADKGAVVALYGTGGGAVTPSVNAGDLAGDTLSWVSQPYSATVNGEDAQVFYAGSAPGLVFGVDQFNVQLPADVPSGAVKIVVKVGGSTSQSNVTVFVK